MEFTLVGEIGWAIGTWDVQNILKQAGGKEITVNFASVGGSVFTGLKMFNLFKNYKGKVNFHIIGEAASMGSYIPLSASGKITAEPNTVYMIHNARGVVYGDHNAMQKRAKIIEGLSGLLKNEYVKRTGRPEAEIKEMMDDETFLFGKDAVDAGFIDEIVGDEPEESEAKETYIAVVKESYEACMKKLSEKIPDDYEQAAALLTDFKAVRSEPKKINPANADNKKPEGSMDLKEAMEKYPAIVAQVTLLEQKAKAAGTDEANDKFKKISAQVAVVFDQETPYPNAIQSTAADVLVGKTEPSVLEALIKFHDMGVEEKKKNEALVEQNGKETHTDLEDGKTKKGVAATTEDVDAIAKADKGM